MLELRRLTKQFANAVRPAVDAIDLKVETGEFLVLVGPSGCGKTTTLTMINRLTEPSSGEILVDGEDVRGLDPVALRRRIGFVFQDVGLFPHMSVAENAAITLRLMGRPKPEIAQRVGEVLELAHLAAAEFRERLPSALSGGQRQRVGLARALAAAPKIMLMDEPFGAIDPLTRDEVATDYREIHDRLGLTTILVTHDMTEAFLLADRIAVMRAGRIVQVARPAELAAAPADEFVRALIDSPRRRAEAVARTMGGR
jgi:osmoprotectant transport system ATP-binding protein